MQIFWWLHTLEIIFKTNHETKYLYKQFHKIRVCKTLAIHENWPQWFRWFHIVILLLLDVQYLCKKNSAFRCIDALVHVCVITCIHLVRLYNFQGTMFYQTNVSASIIDMYMQKCTPFPIVLYKTPQKKLKGGCFIAIKSNIYYL